MKLQITTIDMHVSTNRRERAIIIVRSRAPMIFSAPLIGSFYE